VKKFLLVGDMHVRKDNLEESKRVLGFVNKTAQEEEADTIVFMGDQFDTHGVAHLEVVKLWTDALLEASKIAQIVMIHGNHDMDGSQSLSWNSIFEHGPKYGVTSITKPVQIFKETKLSKTTVVAMPYVKSSEEFSDTIKSMKDKVDGQLVVLCHQEFKNASYGNGFYAPHGVDLNDDRIQDVMFISGHIHKHQILETKEGNTSVNYVGTPRPVSITETDEKYLSVLQVECTVDTRTIPIPEEIAEPFRTVVIKEGESFSPPLELKTRTVFEFHGSKEFVKASSDSLPKGSKVRTFTAQTKKTSSYKESEGVSAALMRYINETCAKKGVSVDSLMQVVDHVCPEIKGF
jgi:DNA repair exonuclease SbcCD nuclease subunit